MDKQTTKKKRTSNKGLFVALGVAVALLVIIVVGLVMFFQSPERQLATGFANLVKAKSVGVNGTISAVTENGTYATTIDAKTNKKLAGADIKFEYTGLRNSKLNGNFQTVVAEDLAIGHCPLDAARRMDGHCQQLESKFLLIFFFNYSIIYNFKSKL